MKLLGGILRKGLGWVGNIGRKVIGGIGRLVTGGGMDKALKVGSGIYNVVKPVLPGNVTQVGDRVENIAHQAAGKLHQMFPGGGGGGGGGPTPIRGPPALTGPPSRRALKYHSARAEVVPS